MHRSRGFLGLFLSGIFFCPTAQADCELEVLRTNLGVRQVYPSPRDLAKLTQKGDFDTHFPGHTGARWLRFRFAAQPQPTDPPWSLTIRNQFGQVLESYGPDNFVGGEDGSGWTGRLPADQGITFDTWPERLEGVLKLREYIAMTEPPGDKTYYSTAVEGIERWRPVENSGTDLTWMRRADGVAFVMSSWDTENRGCTGFAVTSNVLITNWHCGYIDDRHTWTPEICRDTLIDFSFDNDQRSAEYRCHSVIWDNEALDYALLRIEPIDQGRHIRPMPLSRGRRDVGTELAILHHPAGEQKQISRDCSILEKDREGWRTGAPTRFTHLCDTAPGSSGAPVLDPETGVVIGLHHRGLERDPSNCRPNEEPRRNKAIWTSDIVSDIEANRQQIEDKLGRPLQLRVND